MQLVKKNRSRKNSISFVGEKNKGFTLLEFLLSVAIFLIIAATAIPAGSRMISGSDYVNTSNEVVSFLKTAQLNAINGKEDSAWGVKITESSLILFKGDSYLSRDAGYDEKIQLPGSIDVTISEIVYKKVNGDAVSPSSITISANSSSSVININEKGGVTVN